MKNRSSRKIRLLAGVLVAGLAFAPIAAFAQHHGGGGGGSRGSSGGGHSYGGSSFSGARSYGGGSSFGSSRSLGSSHSYSGFHSYSGSHSYSGAHAYSGSVGSYRSGAGSYHSGASALHGGYGAGFHEGGHWPGAGWRGSYWHGAWHGADWFGWGPIFGVGLWFGGPYPAYFYSDPYYLDYSWDGIGAGVGLTPYLDTAYEDPCLVFSGPVGAPYAVADLSVDLHCGVPERELRASFFDHPYFYRGAARFDRVEVTRDGARYYEFHRH